ncbi:MAG: hypothetical protein EXR92_06430 [Gemmatimonadetes bacterium]|nr:hypothetical protein [Gemmatimonadota bacterium]
MAGWKVPGATPKGSLSGPSEVWPPWSEAYIGGVSGSDADDRELLLPPSALAHLRRAFRKEGSALGAVHAFHDAGFATGAAVFEQLSRRFGPEPSGSSETTFWREFTAFFRATGWGDLTHKRVHPGLAILRSNNWSESDPSSGDTQPGCAFTSGVLAHLLGRVAGGPIAVLEVGCRSKGDRECSFVFGSEGAIHDLYGLLLDGAPLETALQRM